MTFLYQSWSCKTGWGLQAIRSCSSTVLLFPKFPISRTRQEDTSNLSLWSLHSSIDQQPRSQDLFPPSCAAPRQHSANQPTHHRFTFTVGSHLPAARTPARRCSSCLVASVAWPATQLLAAVIHKDRIIGTRSPPGSPSRWPFRDQVQPHRSLNQARACPLELHLLFATLTLFIITT